MVSGPKIFRGGWSNVARQYDDVRRARRICLALVSLLMFVSEIGTAAVPISETNMSNDTSARQIRLARRTSSYWRATFDHPPLNIFGPETIPQLNEIVTPLETDDKVKVVVFDSAVEGFF